MKKLMIFSALMGVLTLTSCDNSTDRVNRRVDNAADAAKDNIDRARNEAKKQVDTRADQASKQTKENYDRVKDRAAQEKCLGQFHSHSLDRAYHWNSFGD